MFALASGEIGNILFEDKYVFDEFLHFLASRPLEEQLKFFNEYRLVARLALNGNSLNVFYRLDYVSALYRQPIYCPTVISFSKILIVRVCVGVAVYVYLR